MLTKVLICVLLPCLMTGTLAADYCYSDVVGACSPAGGDLQNCNAKYGHVGGVMKDLQNYANVHITRNWQFLLMSTHFKNFQTQRHGLADLYKEYSDKAWHDTIELIKYITKRGGSMDFAYKKQSSSPVEIENYEMSEIHSLSKSLDIWKNVAVEAHSIHGEAARRRDIYHDPEVASYLENNFVHQHAEIIRDLSGHTNDLKRMLTDSTDASLALFLFDNMLKK
jgi:ferritin heavy chain